MIEKILTIVNVVLENNKLDAVKEIKESTNLREDLNLDSIKLAELTVRIEDEFGIDVFEDGVVNTIGEIIAKLK